MKTIHFLANALKLAQENGTPANIKVGTFEIESKGSLHFWAGRTGTFDTYKLTFQINFRPDHIQRLFDMGVKIDLNKAERDVSEKSPYYAKGKDAIKRGRYHDNLNKNAVYENWLNAPASCSIDTLLKLDKYCRDNHLHHIAIHNDTCTRWAKVRLCTNYKKPDDRFRKLIRKNVHNKRKPHDTLLPIEKRAMNLI
jgi:hypothetical protein